MLTIKSVALHGIEGIAIDVEVDVSFGMAVYVVVGLPDASVKESRERIKTAIENNTGHRLPDGRIIINLAPADLRKEGTAYDLPMALGIVFSGVLKQRIPSHYAIVGELSLEGKVRGVRGTLSRAMTAKKLGLSGIIVPLENADEAALIDGIDVIGVEDLQQTVDFLRGRKEIAPTIVDRQRLFDECIDYHVDMAEVRGQEHARRALEVAAAGGHNVLMVGPPGSGKTMLAQRLPTILPNLNFDEALEVTQIHSVAGVMPYGQPLVATRPFRTIHHSISSAGLAGGGSNPRPGEISLAHNGVLFLDELPEFKRDTLETLRQPMEDGSITISRAAGSIRFPANFMMIAAANPCPCGYLGDNRRRCHCSQHAIKRYMDRISGPLLDRIDMHLELPAVRPEDLKGIPVGESSEKIKMRVERARNAQIARLGSDGVYSNAAMTNKHVQKSCQIDSNGEELMSRALKKLGLSARAYDRIRKVSRTIADLENETDIRAHHVAEAISYRILDRHWN